MQPLQTNKEINLFTDDFIWNLYRLFLRCRHMSKSLYLIQKVNLDWPLYWIIYIVIPSTDDEILFRYKKHIFYLTKKSACQTIVYIYDWWIRYQRIHSNLMSNYQSCTRTYVCVLCVVDMTKRKSNDLTPVAEHPSLDEVYEATPFSEAFWTYLNYIILNIFGWFRDFLRNTRIENRKGSAENNPPVNITKSNCILFFF